MKKNVLTFWGSILETSVSFSKRDEIIEHLKTLSNTELIDLVMEFSSEDFKKEIVLKRAIIKESNIKIVSNINMDMNNYELQSNPELFQDKISEYSSTIINVIRPVNDFTGDFTR